MQVVTQVNEKNELEQIIVTSSKELINIMQHLIIRKIDNQVNIHIKENGMLELSVPKYQELKN